MLGIEDGVSPPFEMDNRGKRSIMLDLTTDEGRSTALELLSEADVFLTNVRPAALRRVGLDFETVADGTAPPIVVSVAAPAGARRSPDAVEGRIRVTTPGFDGPAVTQMRQHYIRRRTCPGRRRAGPCR